MKIAVSICVVAVLLGNLSAQIAAQSPASLEERVAKLEEDIDVARQRFLANMRRCRDSIDKAKTSPDVKRELYRVVDKAIQEFENSNDLPDHPTLIQLSYNYAQSTQKIMLFAEKLRQDIVAEELSGGSVAQLEHRVHAIAEGSDSFQPGAQWHGKRTYPDGNAQGITIFIDKVIGSQFVGRLEQSYQGGSSDVMEISGTRVGNDVNFRTTGMKLGAGRMLAFDGCLIGSKLFAQVSGRAATGKPASGFISARK